MLIDNTNKRNVVYSEINDELSDLKNDNVQRTVQRISERDTVKETKGKPPDRRRQEHTSNGRVLEKDTTTRIKSRNFLTNIA